MGGFAGTAPFAECDVRHEGMAEDDGHWILSIGTVEQHPQRVLSEELHVSSVGEVAATSLTTFKNYGIFQ